MWRDLTPTERTSCDFLPERGGAEVVLAPPFGQRAIGMDP